MDDGAQTELSLHYTPRPRPVIWSRSVDVLHRHSAYIRRWESYCLLAAPLQMAGC